MVLALVGPGLLPRHFAAEDLTRLARIIKEQPLHDTELIKAFATTNDADTYYSHAPPLQWSCQAGTCSSTFQQKCTLGQALTLTQATMAARVNVEALHPWIEALEEALLRKVLNADAYMTVKNAVSASLGWHIDDVDVLLIMLDGRKRFRVGGDQLGSNVIIDHYMEPGDALYIPALTFHSGGSSEIEKVASSSTLLSLAFTPRVGDIVARDKVTRWREARRILGRRLPSPASRRWDWISTVEGQKWLAHIEPSLSPDWREAPQLQPTPWLPVDGLPDAWVFRYLSRLRR